MCYSLWSGLYKYIIPLAIAIDRAILSCVCVCFIGHSELVSYLEDLKSCVSKQCKELVHILPTLSSHWLQQIGQLEQDKAQLLQ